MVWALFSSLIRPHRTAGQHRSRAQSCARPATPRTRTSCARRSWPRRPRADSITPLAPARGQKPHPGPGRGSPRLLLQTPAILEMAITEFMIGIALKAQPFGFSCCFVPPRRAAVTTAGRLDAAGGPARSPRPWRADNARRDPRLAVHRSGPSDEVDAAADNDDTGDRTAHRSLIRAPRGQRSQRGWRTWSPAPGAPRRTRAGRAKPYKALGFPPCLLRRRPPCDPRAPASGNAMIGPAVFVGLTAAVRGMEGA